MKKIIVAIVSSILIGGSFIIPADEIIETLSDLKSEYVTDNYSLSVWNAAIPVLKEHLSHRFNEIMESEMNED